MQGETSCPVFGIPYIHVTIDKRLLTVIGCSCLLLCRDHARSIVIETRLKASQNECPKQRLPQFTPPPHTSEGRARWAISPHCRETNGQIKQHRQKATDHRQRQSSIDLKRNSSEVLTANYTKLRTSRSARAIINKNFPLPSLSINHLQLQLVCDPQPMQSNLTSTLSVHFSRSQRGRNAKISNQILSNKKILNKCKVKQWKIKYKTS